MCCLWFLYAIIVTFIPQWVGRTVFPNLDQQWPATLLQSGQAHDIKKSFVHHSSNAHHRVGCGLLYMAAGAAYPYHGTVCGGIVCTCFVAQGRYPLAGFSYPPGGNAHPAVYLSTMPFFGAILPVISNIFVPNTLLQCVS